MRAPRTRAKGRSRKAPVMALRQFHELSWRIQRNLLTAWPKEAYRSNLFVCRWMLRPALVANCPEAAKHVLLDKVDNYVKSSLARQLLKPLGRGLLTSEGELWRRQRRTVAPAFHPRRLESLTPAMVEATREMLAGWEREPEGAVVDLAEAFGQLTLQIITRTMFSINIRGRAADLRAVFLQSESVGNRPSVADLMGLPAWFPRHEPRQVREAAKLLDRMMLAIIARRRREGGPDDDLLGRMLAAGNGNGAADDVALRDQIVTFFSAGHETTANSLAWAFYLLSQHADVEARLHAELAERLGGRAPGYADLARLRYTRMVLEESMRLLPGANLIPREALADDEIMGRKVRKGSTVLVWPWLLHRHEKLWVRPRAFDPERFAPERAGERRRFAYIPFSAGPRACIGAGFAMQEALLILAMVAQRFRLRATPATKVAPVGLVLIRPRYGLPMRLERR